MEETTMTSPVVAETILQQLGGNRFMAMTGARGLTYDENSLTFKITRAQNKITHVKITLDPSDTYNVSFINCRKTAKGFKNEVVKSFSDVFNVHLSDCFTSQTGLYTRL